MSSEPMISYAQNYEDVVLDRALRASNGFYVDVGAASPSVASVTRHFYDNGWTGINIEPLPEYAAALRAERPRDTTLQAVAGSAAGRCHFHIPETDHDLSTANPQRAGELADAGERVTVIDMEVVTLNAVLETANPATIDFLKIDVEGAERDVLMGIDLARWQPRVLVIESTSPGTLVPSYAAWEDLVLGAGYLYASTDGINRYYVRPEDAALLPLLVPANALDPFTPASTQLLVEELDRVRGYVAHLETELAAKERHIGELTHYVRTLEAARHSG